MGQAMTDEWWKYVQKISHKAGPAKIAEQTKIPGPTISRWDPTSKGGPATPKPDNVVRFAHAYEVSPLEALLHAGYGINRDDLRLPVGSDWSIDDAPDADVIDLLVRRFEELRRLQRGRHDTKKPSGPFWDETKNPRVRGVQRSDEGG